ncbi:MAG: hypothetical protein ACYTGK_13565 [Planctomycetota bacterium]
MTPETDHTSPQQGQGERDAEAAPRRPAWPLGAPGEGIPRWLAWIVLVALLAASVASVWLVLTLPPHPAPGARDAPASGEEPAR